MASGKLTHESRRAMASAVPFLTTADALADLAEEIRRAGRAALDTEFVWERTYRPVLGVVQVATPARAVIVDAVALPDLSPLFPVLQSPDIPVVLHGGTQDLEILASLMGAPVRNVVDTQIEAAFLGYGLQVGLGTLLERVLNVRIRKDQTYTDWVRRPLSPAQIEYALADVAHLLPLHDVLRRELRTRSREAWVEEELRELEAPARWQPVPDDERYRQVKGWQRLEPRAASVLRALAAWRERTARRANIRPHFLASDAVLTVLASRPPRDLAELRGVRGLTAGTVERHGKGMLAAIEEGLRCPDGSHPARPVRTRRPAPPTGLAALLRAAVAVVADQEDLASEVIASTRDLERLVEVATGTAADAEGERPLGLLHGWRRQLVGERLLAIARGELAMRYDPRRREVTAEPLTPRA